MDKVRQINDRALYLDMYSSQCATCRHFDWFEYTCAAFPEEIPDSILAGTERHDSPRKGQTGDTVYDPMEGLSSNAR